VVLVGVGRAVTEGPGDENTPALIPLFGTKAVRDDNAGYVFVAIPQDTNGAARLSGSERG
jgi:hypothetical protein